MARSGNKVGTSVGLGLACAGGPELGIMGSRRCQGVRKRDPGGGLDQLGRGRGLRCEKSWRFGVLRREFEPRALPTPAAY